jgi:hypothetical protein
MISRRTLRITLAILAFIAIALITFVATIRYMAPSDWRRIVLSPAHLGASFIAYRELLSVTSVSDERKLWHYEIAVEPAPAGEIQIVYAPRIRVDASREQKRYPGAHIRICSGIELHVFINGRTLQVRRAYIAK